MSNAVKGFDGTPVTFNELAFNTTLRANGDFTLVAGSWGAGVGSLIPPVVHQDGFGGYTYEFDHTNSAHGSSLSQGAEAGLTFQLQLSAAQTALLAGTDAQKGAEAAALFELPQGTTGTASATGGLNAGNPMYFGAHVYNAINPVDKTLSTDYIGANLNTNSSVPVPSSIVMLASLVPGFGVFLYRRRKAATAA
jgi:hypothetical protein